LQKPAQQANEADATDLAFFKVDFGTLRLSVIEVCVGAADWRALASRRKYIQSLLIIRH